MKTSQTGINLIKSFEGLALTAYVCPAGVLTIGYGHTGPDVQQGQRITEQQAENILKSDLKRFESAVSSLVKVPINQHQFDALVSFAFNCGIGALSDSTLLKRLNAGEDPNNVVKEEIPRWNKGEGGRVLEGLTRRRMAEVELFCQAAPQLKSGMVDITAKFNTWVKKRPVQTSELKSDEKAPMVQSRVIRNCKILQEKEGHTQVEMGFGLGTWWVFNDHWLGLTTSVDVKPYAVDGDLRYLRNFPYFYQQNNGPEGWRQCQSSSIAMCLKYLDVPGINDDLDYLKIVNKYGDTTWRDPHFKALADLKVSAKFTQNADAQDIKDEINKGRPVVAGVLHHGTPSKPTGGGHYIVITGYNSTHWLAQDPYGELDLVNGGWTATGAVSGRNIKYSFKNLNPRIFVGGGSDGWCWFDFKKL